MFKKFNSYFTTPNKKNIEPFQGSQKTHPRIFHGFHPWLLTFNPVGVVGEFLHQGRNSTAALQLKSCVFFSGYK
jgi:hypothetical protein